MCCILQLTRVPWKDLQEGDSTESEDDSKEPMYEGRDMVSDSDVDKTQPTYKRKISDVIDAASGKLPGEYRHIRQSIKRVRPEFYIMLTSAQTMTPTPSSSSCDNCCQQHV